jgi:hypothetical protein
VISGIGRRGRKVSSLTACLGTGLVLDRRRSEDERRRGVDSIVRLVLRRLKRFGIEVAKDERALVSLERLLSRPSSAGADGPASNISDRKRVKGLM